MVSPRITLADFPHRYSGIFRGWWYIRPPTLGPLTQAPTVAGKQRHTTIYIPPCMASGLQQFNLMLRRVPTLASGKSYTMLELAVEPRRIELRLPACKAGVLPLNEGPMVPSQGVCLSYLTWRSCDIRLLGAATHNSPVIRTGNFGDCSPVNLTPTNPEHRVGCNTNNP